MKEETYSNKEIADELGISVQQLIGFMFEMGLIDENGRATEFALENGLMVEKEIQISYEGDQDPPFILLN
jgi:predicted transcriptional regulator